MKKEYKISTALMDLLVSVSWVSDIIKFKSISKIIAKFMIWKFNLKLNDYLHKTTLEYIIYDFAVTVYCMGFGTTEGKLTAIRHKIDPDLKDLDYGIKYKLITDDKEVISSIHLDIWTKDKMAQIFLDLSNTSAGVFINTIRWCYKDEQSGKFMVYSRANEILKCRDELKNILEDIIYTHVNYIIKWILRDFI